MELQEFKPRHGDGSGEAEWEHEGAERGAEPTESSMDADVMRAHERGLQNEEEHPDRERGRVDPEDGRTRYVRVQEIRVDGLAEARDDECHHEQRHGEVEIFVDETVAAGDGT